MRYSIILARLSVNLASACLVVNTLLVLDAVVDIFKDINNLYKKLYFGYTYNYNIVDADSASKRENQDKCRL